MPTTSNFGWTTPADTDLVKDGAAAIRTLGNGIDTSLVDLKGGTTGQILSKNSNTDLDYIWINNDQGDITAVTAGTGLTGGGTTGAVTLTNDMATTITASGDIVVGTGNGTYDNLPIGTTGQVLTADTTVSPYKVKWAAASTGAMTKVADGSFTSAATVTVDNVFTSTYKRYALFVRWIHVTTGGTLQWQFRYGSSTETGSTYFGSGFRQNRANTKSDYGFSSATYATIDTGGATNANSLMWMYLDQVGNSSQLPYAFQQGLSSDSQAVMQSTIYNSQSRTYTGFILTPSAGTLTGEYVVYGLAN